MVVDERPDEEWRATNDSTSGFTRLGASSFINKYRRRVRTVVIHIPNFIVIICICDTPEGSVQHLEAQQSLQQNRNSQRIFQVRPVPMDLYRPMLS